MILNLVPSPAAITEARAAERRPSRSRLDGTEYAAMPQNKEFADHARQRSKELHEECEKIKESNAEMVRLSRAVISRSASQLALSRARRGSTKHERD
jgi:hypothetical protein